VLRAKPMQMGFSVLYYTFSCALFVQICC